MDSAFVPLTLRWTCPCGRRPSVDACPLRPSTFPVSLHVFVFLSLSPSMYINMIGVCGRACVRVRGWVYVSCPGFILEGKKPKHFPRNYAWFASCGTINGANSQRAVGSTQTIVWMNVVATLPRKRGKHRWALRTETMF